mmetsp:Transcript_35280/g.87814  ORF Transcript_35280/g.87814 Transcript_35280/m.87814 type:complete len:289 (-) Transcript_35280:19-885(-)
MIFAMPVRALLSATAPSGRFARIVLSTAACRAPSFAICASDPSAWTHSTPIASTAAAHTCGSSPEAHTATRAPIAPCERASAAASREAVRMCTSARQQGSTRPCRCEMKSTSNCTAPSSYSWTAAGMDPLARICSSVAAHAASSRSEPAVRMHSTRAGRASCGSHSLTASACWQASARVRQACRRTSGSLCETRGRVASNSPHFCSGLAYAAPCLQVEPSIERQTRRTTSEGSSFRQRRTSCGAPQSRTACAVSGEWSAMVPRHQTVATRTEVSALSSLSQSGGSALH